MQYTDIIKYCNDNSVTLVAVSKTKPISQIQEIYAQGQRIFGENRVDELVSKKAEMASDIEWHFIGRLQSKKVKKLIPHASLIHSVDSTSLLHEIQKRSLAASVTTNILLQPKIAEEEAKQGLNTIDLQQIIKEYSQGKYPNIIIKGLMGMATFTSDQDQVAAEFKGLKATFDSIRETHPMPGFETLSMGMSGDYELAIDSGSNMVRIGSLIFGQRA